MYKSILIPLILIVLGVGLVSCVETTSRRTPDKTYTGKHDKLQNIIVLKLNYHLI